MYVQMYKENATIIMEIVKYLKTTLIIVVSLDWASRLALK